MARKTNEMNVYTDSDYSILRHLSIIFVESFKNLKKTTQIMIKKNGNGEKVIRVGIKK